MSSETLNYYAPEGIELNVTVARFHVDRIDTVPPGPYYLENDRNGNVHQMILRGPSETSNNPDRHLQSRRDGCGQVRSPSRS